MFAEALVPFARIKAVYEDAYDLNYSSIEDRNEVK